MKFKINLPPGHLSSWYSLCQESYFNLDLKTIDASFLSSSFVTREISNFQKMSFCLDQKKRTITTTRAIFLTRNNYQFQFEKLVIFYCLFVCFFVYLLFFRGHIFLQPFIYTCNSASFHCTLFCSILICVSP